MHMTWNLPSNRYEEIRKVVADVLEDYGIEEYPFSLFGFIQSLGIRLVPYSLLPNEAQTYLREDGVDGFTKRDRVFNPLQTVVFYDNERSLERIRFTLAHELGHIFLEHPDTGEKTYEDEANLFANYFLAPNPLVVRDSENDAIRIMDDFFVSYSCACAIRDRTLKRVRWGGDLLEHEMRILSNCHLKKGGDKVA